MNDKIYNIRFREDPSIDEVEDFLREVLGEYYTERESSWYGGISGTRAFYSYPGDMKNLKIFVPEPLISNGKMNIPETLKNHFDGKWSLV